MAVLARGRPCCLASKGTKNRGIMLPIEYTMLLKAFTDPY